MEVWRKKNREDKRKHIKKKKKRKHRDGNGSGIERVWPISNPTRIYISPL